MIKKPAAILALLTGLNFLNYFDRLVVAAVLKDMQADLHLSNFEGGLLATLFLVGYFATSPIFGALADRGARTRLIAFGVVTWSLATAATGLTNSMATLIAARIMVGVGEASYATLAPTIIDDITPPEKKGKALAIFYLATPLGAAAGYILGGLIGHAWGWRAAFFLAGGPGIVLALSCLLIVEPPRKLAAAGTRMIDSIRALWKIPLYRRAVIGYSAQTAAVGAFSYWAPKYIDARYNMSLGSVWFGAVTVVAGTIGTIVGGRWADHANRQLPVLTAETAYDGVDNRRGANLLLRICAIGVVFAAPLTAVAFLSPGPVMFFSVVFFVEVGIFFAASPVNAVMLRTVPAEMRASAMAICLFAIHLFGDLWSPTAIGLVADYTPMVVAMMGLPILLGLSAYLWWPRAREAAP